MYKKNKEIPGLSAWRHCLARKFGSTKAQQLSESIRQRYQILLKEKPLPAHPLLLRHSKDHILPGLALYQVLLQEYGNDRPAALAEVDEAFRESTIAENRFQFSVLRLLPIPGWLFRLIFNLRMRDFPTEGWDFETVEKSQNRFAFNATRCFYLQTLTDFKAPELTAAFCKTDEVMAELFPQTVRFIRPHTLGRGDALCDFEYCLSYPKKSRDKSLNLEAR